MFSSATQPLPPPSPPPPRHNFVVSAITFEEFKLHSSNFTHALLIQISRTSCVKLCIDLKWQEMRSKVIFGHKKWPTAAGLSKFPKKIKVAKVFFGHPKWPIELFSNIQYVRRWPFCKHFFFKFPYLSKMARNAIESEFRTSKMAHGSHFVKKFPKTSCVSI